MLNDPLRDYKYSRLVEESWLFKFKTKEDIIKSVKYRNFFSRRTYIEELEREISYESMSGFYLIEEIIEELSIMNIEEYLEYKKLIEGKSIINLRKIILK